MFKTLSLFSSFFVRASTTDRIPAPPHSRSIQFHPVRSHDAQQFVRIHDSAPVLSSIPAVENLHEMSGNKTRFPRSHLVIGVFLFFFKWTVGLQQTAKTTK